MLLAPLEFPDVFHGRTMGSTVVPAGGTVALVDIGANGVTVRRTEATKTIPASATNLPQLAALAMAGPAPVPTSPGTVTATPEVSAPTPEPSPSEATPVPPFGQPGAGAPEDVPRVYVGSAYQPATTDMATKPDEWKVVRANAGFHEHPVGWHSVFTSWNLGRQLLSAYQHRYFTAEEDIGGLGKGGSGTHWAHTVIEQGAKYGQTWQCVALTVNFHTDALLADPPKAARELKEYCQDADRLHVPYYLLFSPVSPEAVAVFDQQVKPYENQPVWVWVAQHAGAAGVAIDCPAPFVANPRWRGRAVEIYRTTHQAGLKFI